MKTTMRKFISSILALCMLLTLMPTAVFAAEATEEQIETVTQDVTWVMAEDGTLTCTGAGILTNESYYENNIDHTSIKRIVIGEGITGIEDGLFLLGYYVEEIVLPSTLTWVGDIAFGYVGAFLNKVTYPGTADQLAEILGEGNDYILQVFQNGGPITSGSCGENITWSYDGETLTVSGTGHVHDTTWEHLSMFITKIVIGEGIESIGYDAFGNCYDLEELTLPMSLEVVGLYAFCNSNRLMKVNYPGTAEQLAAILDEGNEYVLESFTGMGTSGSCGENASWEVSEDGVLTITGTGSVDNLELGRYTSCIAKIEIAEGITALSTGIFDDCYWVTEVTIPASMKIIEGWVFSDCYDLEKVNYPGTLEQLQRICRGNNSMLLDAFSGEVLTSGFCGENARWKISEDGVLTITGTGEVESGSWYNHQKNVLKIVIGEGITAIADEIFGYLDSVREITIPSSVRKIGSGILGGNYDLQKVNYPGTVEQLQSICGMRNEDLLYAFNGRPLMDGICGENSRWHLSEDGTLTIYGTGEANYNSWGFHGDAIRKVVIEEGITNVCGYGGDLHDYAFGFCEQIREVTIPASMEKIGWHAFSACDLLEKVNYPGTAAELQRICECKYDKLPMIFNGGPMTHGYCGENSTWSLSEDGVLTISGTGLVERGAWFYSEDDYFSDGLNITSVVVEEGITELDWHLFDFCYWMSEVTLPESLTVIGYAAFDDCWNLEQVNYPGTREQLLGICEEGNDILANVFFPSEGTCGENAFWKLTEDGTLTISGSGEMANYDYENYYNAPWYHCRSQVESLMIEDGITTIGSYAFIDCSNLVNVSLPDSITTIRNDAFFACSSMKDLVIPENVTSIGYEAFAYCTGLTSLTIPASVTYMGDFVFAFCNLAVIFEGNAPKFEPFCFWGTQVRAYYPAGNPTWTEAVQQKYIGDITWIALDHDCSSLQFTDVPKSTNWAHEGIDFAVSNGLFNGMSATTFGPNETMTRAMLVTVLWRLEGQPKPTGANPFTDVRSGQYYTDPVIWASENGIVNGVGNGKFDPNGKITREQLATILYRYSVMKGYDTSARASISGFPDAKKVSSWATDSLSWANATGLITGSSVQGTVYLLPGGNATRAQVATIFMRFVNSI